MVNRSKNKGTKMESDVAAYFNNRGLKHIERRALSGAADKGDIAGLKRNIIECKDHATFNLAGWADEALVEQQNAKAEFGWVFFRRKNKAIGRGYALLPIEQAITLIGLVENYWHVELYDEEKE